VTGSSAIARWAQDALDALFPPACRVCGAAAAPVAAEGPSAPGSSMLACAEHAFRGRLTGIRCGRCAVRLPRGLPHGARCATCRHSTPAFAGVTALGDYHEEPGLRDWLLAFKHGGRRDLGALLGELLGERAREEPGERSCFVPVPLHWLRRAERGHDQAALLARAAASAADGRLVRALTRRRWTAPQGGPGASSRAANVRDAFALRRRRASLVEGRAVWLVDDVLTSGATASACARLLRRAGAAEVRVLCVARVEPRASATLPP